VDRNLLPLALILAALFLFNYDVLLEDSPPLIKKSCQFFSFLCLTIGIGWIYTSVHRNPKRAVLKVLDWSLVCFFLVMLPVFEVLGLPPLFTVPLLVFLLAARLFVTWYLKTDDLRFLDLGFFLTIFGVGIVLALFGMMGARSKSTGLTDFTPSILVVVGICLAITRFIIIWWKRKRSKGEV